MPALKSTDFIATVEWLGSVADRDTALTSAPLEKMPLSFAGAEAEDHAGLTRASCVRVKTQYAQGTQIRNTRQLSVVSQEQLDLIAKDMGLSQLSPHLIGASLVISGIPDWTHVPPSARLVDEDPSGPGLVVDMENRPCTLPARYIEADHPGFGKAFKPAAFGRRGVTMWVEKEGTLRLGQSLRLHIPDQPAWKGR
ncbi:MAG: MOSC domain-containing protein [Pseudomonadota bacterium]